MEGLVKMKLQTLILIVATFFTFAFTVAQQQKIAKYMDDDDDTNGYLTFCPCMGRLGNQVDQYLGALLFAKELNRTMLLPAWVTYVRGLPNSVQVPFTKYFKLSAVQEYHRSLPLEEFMESKADRLWPQQHRRVFCYQKRSRFTDGPDLDGGCNAKDGNPFGSFWNTYHVDFTSSEFYAPLHFDGDFDTWKKKYPASQFPVLAFTGAPGPFPVREANRHLQRYLQWSDEVSARGEQFIQSQIDSQPFVAIHLRNGADWDNVCKIVEESRNLFASPQCLGERLEHGAMYQELCNPPRSIILKQVQRALKKLKTKHLFVATDNDDLSAYFNKKIKNVLIHRTTSNEPTLDLYLMARAGHLLANCVSSFSSIAVRERQVHNRSTEFLAFPKSLIKSKDEL